jgi:hypothetical protein
MGSEMYKPNNQIIYLSAYTAVMGFEKEDDIDFVANKAHTIAKKIDTAFGQKLPTYLDIEKARLLAIKMMNEMVN